MGFEDTIILQFLVSGHTKNHCDGSFGRVRRHLKTKEVLNPSDMRQVIDDGSSTNSYVLSKTVAWINWRDFLCQIFAVPRQFHITKYHIVLLVKGNIGVLKAKYLLTT